MMTDQKPIGDTMNPSELIPNEIFPFYQDCIHCQGTGLVVAGQEEITKEDIWGICPDCLDIFLSETKRLLARIINSRPMPSETWAQTLSQFSSWFLALRYDANIILQHLHHNPVGSNEEENQS